MAEVVQLTLAGKKALEDKLEYLKNVRRAEITEEIAVARSFGDLSENAEYDAAKDAQAHNELEIMELEAMLKNVVIIDETHTDGKTVTMGSIVRIKFVDLGFEDEFKIADVIASRLRNEQYIVDVYGDAEEGLDNALTNIYDLIILDVMLPGIEGFKILQEIRKQKIESKVIMLTAKSML